MSIEIFSLWVQYQKLCNVKHNPRDEKSGFCLLYSREYSQLLFKVKDENIALFIPLMNIFLYLSVCGQ